LFLLSHEGRSWTKDPTHPRPFMNIEEFLTELYALSFMLLSLFFEFDWHEMGQLPHSQTMNILS
jgi:hypothetical protein